MALFAAIVPLQIQIDSAELPNVVYHLSCLSERIPSRRTEIEKFWKEDLKWTSVDQRQLEQWKIGTNEAGKTFRIHFPTINWGDFADRERYPEMNLMMTIPYDKLDAIAGSWKEIVPLSLRHHGFAFSLPRKNKGRVYILAGRDDQTVAEVVKRLAALQSTSGNGFILSVD